MHIADRPHAEAAARIELMHNAVAGMPFFGTGKSELFLVDGKCLGLDRFEGEIGRVGNAGLALHLVMPRPAERV